jgi:hypothetical protein
MRRRIFFEFLEGVVRALGFVPTWGLLLSIVAVLALLWFYRSQAAKADPGDGGFWNDRISSLEGESDRQEEDSRPFQLLSTVGLLLCAFFGLGFYGQGSINGVVGALIVAGAIVAVSVRDRWTAILPAFWGRRRTVPELEQPASPDGLTTRCSDLAVPPPAQSSASGMDCGTALPIEPDVSAREAQ